MRTYFTPSSLQSSLSRTVGFPIQCETRSGSGFSCWRLTTVLMPYRSMASLSPAAVIWPER